MLIKKLLTSTLSLALANRPLVEFKLALALMLKFVVATGVELVLSSSLQLASKNMAPNTLKIDVLILIILFFIWFLLIKHYKT
jgi:hypothetical protein